MLGVHDATNPDRTLSRAEAAEHNGAWTWTPPPAVAARHPDIALPGSSIQYATSAPSPAPIVGGTAMPATSFGTQVPAPTTESAAVQHDNECEPKRYGKRPADALENDEVSAADEDDASADLTIAQSRPKRHRGGHELTGVQEVRLEFATFVQSLTSSSQTRTLELDATGKLKLTLMPGIQAVRVPIADAATTTSPASAAAEEQIQLFYQWYNTDNATVRRELVAVIDNPEEGGSEVAVRSQIVQNGASDSIGRGISTLAHGRFVRAITSDEVEVEVEEDGDALPTMEE